MSEESVEIVRFAYELGYDQRTVEPRGFDGWFSPEYRYHARPDFPGQTVYRLDELTTLWADLDATYTDHRLVPEDYEDLGDHVLVRLQQTARLRGSDQDISGTIYMLWRVSALKIQETWTFTSRAEALEAVGLSE